MHQVTIHVFLFQKVLQQVEYLLAMALQDDERQRYTDAITMYTCALDYALMAVSTSLVLEKCCILIV